MQVLLLSDHHKKSSSTARLTLPPSVEAYQYQGHGVLSHNDSYDC